MAICQLAANRLHEDLEMGKTKELGRGVRNKVDPNLILSQQFAQCLCAFRECSEEVQTIILEMAKIVNDPEATEDEHAAAVATIAEALFPCGVNGSHGVDLEELESITAEHATGRLIIEEMDQEEATFADRVNN